MSTRPCARLGACLLLLGLTSCWVDDRDPESTVAPAGLAQGQSITYVGKQSITDFTGYGQHLQYWPLFGLTSGQTARRTDDPACIELTPSFANFKHHYLLEGRTFSNDALGNPIGTKTRGGYPTWAMFTLPDGRVGRSGTFYDESNVDNSNNTVNQMRINVSTLTEFCLNLVTDNTNHEHDADVLLEARSDNVDLSLAGNPDLTFDGQTDMYTFRYEGMREDDLVKIRFQCSSASGCLGAGLGGIMVSDISTCTAAPDPGPGNPDAGAPVSPGLDAEPPGGSLDGNQGGCGCHTGAARPPGAGLVLGFAVAMALRRRRRPRATA